MNIVNKKLNLSSFSNSKQVELEKAYTEGVYCDSPANRKLGRVGMTYAAYAAKLKGGNKEKENPKKENKTDFNIEDYKTIPSKDTLEKLSLEELKRNLYSTGLQIDSCKMDLKKTKLLGAQRRAFFNKKQDSIARGETLKKNIEKIIKDKKSEKENKNNIDKILAKSDDLGRAKGKRLDAIISYAEFDNVPKNATDEEKRRIIAENYIKSAELSGTPEEIANDLDEIIEDAIADYVPPKKKDDTEERKKLSYIEARTVLNYSDTLANATTRQLNNVIDYSGFDIDKKLSDDEKREKLTQKYYASADLYELKSAKEVADALDGIIEDALEDYVPPKK